MSRCTWNIHIAFITELPNADSAEENDTLEISLFYRLKGSIHPSIPRCGQPDKTRECTQAREAATHPLPPEVRHLHGTLT